MLAIPQSLWADRYGTPTLIYRLLTEYGLRYWRAYALSFVLMGIAAACTALSAYLIGHVVNEAQISRSYSNLALLCIVAVIVFTVRGLAFYGQAVLLAQTTNALVAGNQERMFDKLLRENLAHFSNRSSVASAAQVTYGAASVPAALNLLISAIGRDGLSLLGLMVVMIVQDPLLSVIALLVGPIAALLARDVIKRVRSMALGQYGASTSVFETMQETLQGFRVVKAFGLENEMRQRIGASAQRGRRMGDEMARLSNRSSPMMEALGGLVIALVILYGGYRVIETGATPGEFVSFLTAFLLAYEPAKRLTRLHVSLAGVLTGVRVMFEFLDTPPTEADDEFRPALRVSAGRVEFAAVEFAYRADEPVLRRMAFCAAGGRVTALVGSSGGGKSTALNLILRLYEPNQGTISIDGQDIATVSRRSLREQIAYVGQDVFLFRGSIRDNIRYGRQAATDDEIAAAAAAAHAHDFIMTFPAGYETQVGEQGLQLSSGQRQRVAIARALLKDAPIVLLDEPTAALDSESERLVQDAIGVLCAGRTTLVIAHRLHTITHAYQILVVEGGVVVESGAHDALLRGNGRYAEFYRLQARGAEAKTRA
jgi:subfamily B ATP-binding cassette protein MsbA